MNRTASLLAVSLALLSSACGPASAPLAPGKQSTSQALFHALRPASAEPTDTSGQGGAGAASSVKGRVGGAAKVAFEVSVTSGNVAVRRSITYVDFTEDGKTFYNGTLAVDVLVKTSATSAVVKYAAKGKVTLSGAVNDFLEADVAIEVDSTSLSSTSGSASVKLAGKVTTSTGAYQYGDEAFAFDVAAGLPTQSAP